MGTILSFLSGRQITNDNGTPQSGAKLLHYLEDTVSDLTVYQDSAGSTPHAQPVVCDSGGFVPLIYVDDTSDWKVIITDADDVELQTYNNLDKGPTDESSVGFAPPLFEWTQVTNAASPVSLSASDAGNAYEADTTSGNIEFDLPSAASVGNGKGFLFKKVASANSMIIDPSSSETIDDDSSSITITELHGLIGIFSNGAEYYKVYGVVAAEMLISSFINSLTEVSDPADDDEFLMQLASGGAFRKVPYKYFPGALIAIIEDQKSQNTGGQTLNAGADRTRNLNTLVFNRDSIVSLSSNQFTLPAGTWEIEWFAGVGDSTAAGPHQTLLYNATDTTEVQRGTSGTHDTSTITDLGAAVSVGSSVVTIASSKAFEIRHRVTTSSDGGGAANFGTEVYARVVIRKA